MRLQTFAFFQFFILMSNCIQTHTYYESQFVFSHQQADFCTLSDYDPLVFHILSIAWNMNEEKASLQEHKK